jgi:hypothetical protein
VVPEMEGAKIAEIHFKAGRWPLTIKTTRPGVLLLQTGAQFSARLRERRQPRRDGAVFVTRESVSARNRDGTVARLFPLTVRTEQNALEAEIIYEHAPVEFFIDAIRE